MQRDILLLTEMIDAAEQARQLTAGSASWKPRPGWLHQPPLLSRTVVFCTQLEVPASPYHGLFARSVSSPPLAASNDHESLIAHHDDIPADCCHDGEGQAEQACGEYRA